VGFKRELCSTLMFSRAESISKGYFQNGYKLLLALLQKSLDGQRVKKMCIYTNFRVCGFGLSFKAAIFCKVSVFNKFLTFLEKLDFSVPSHSKLLSHTNICNGGFGLIEVLLIEIVAFRDRSHCIAGEA
jgi:hypothetical protein